MAIQADAVANYESVSTGVHNAVLAQVIDLGMVPNRFYDENQPGSRPTNRQIVYVFQLEERKEDGTRQLKEFWFNLSAHEKSNIAKFLNGWYGRHLSPEELQLDHESLVGQPLQVIISENKNKKNIITSALAPDKNNSIEVEPYDYAEYEKQLNERQQKMEDKWANNNRQSFNNQQTVPHGNQQSMPPQASPVPPQPVNQNQQSDSAPLPSQQIPDDKIPF